MTTNHKPATALPWTAFANDVNGKADRVSGLSSHVDAAYITHSANAYPKLVEALRNLRAAVQRGVFDDIGPDIQPDSVAADALLRELGE